MTRAPLRLRRAAAAAVCLALSVSGAAACGGERWAVAVAADKNRVLVADYPRTAGIPELAAIRAPGDPAARPDTRFLPTEAMVYEVSGTLLSIQKMADGEFRLVVADPDQPQATIVAAAPGPGCAAGSRYAANIVAVRDALRRRFGRFSWLTPGVPVTMTGIAFFAVRRGLPGEAPNGLELEPLIGVAFP